MEKKAAPQIIVIDDDESVLEIADIILEKAGFKVTSATSVEAGKNLFDSQTCDMVLCDIQLPDASGMEMLKYVHQQNVGVPVVMMTNFGSLQRVEEALKLGACAFISKPIRKEHLLKTLNLVMKGGKMSWEQIVSEENIYSYFTPPA